MTTEQMDEKDDFYKQMDRARRDVADFMGVPIEAIQITLNHDVTEEHTHYTREARDQCAAGDHQYAKLLDDAAEREKVLRDRADADEGERERMFESRAASIDRLWKRGIIDEQRYHELRQQLREEFGYYREPSVINLDEPLSEGDRVLYGGAFKNPDVTTMASEPREHAERRQWLDGYLAGFREGFERAGWR